MSNKLTEQPTSTTQPTDFIVNLAGAIKRLNWAGFKALLDALYAAIGHDHDADYAPISHAHSASDITSGTIDVARLPVLYSGVQVVSSGGIADLDGGQQTTITQGAVVTTTDGRRWVYSGSGSKTSEASYIELGDVSPTWDVIAGKPSTFAPSTHASAHASGGSDAIKLDDLAPPDDNTDLDATTSAHGLMSKADKTKLDGVEASADVTDAGNVGAAIHGASGKTTPVDADTLPLIDSAASNVLKKLTWANLKATLKTYFDALYAAVAHTHALSSLTQSSASTGQVPTWNGSAWAPATPSGGGGGTNVQDFTANGTWTKPVGAKWCKVVLIGRGGAGYENGGGGGGPGGVSIFECDPTFLGSTEPVTVDDDSLAITAGRPATIFAGVVALNGLDGTNLNGGAGDLIATGEGVATAQSPGGSPGAPATQFNAFSPTGGGGGANVAGAGHAGGDIQITPFSDIRPGGLGGAGGTVGSPDGGAGDSGSNFGLFGTGGGGGGYGIVDYTDAEDTIDGNGGDGGAGANYGGGGGGGGSCEGGGSPGLGGAGGLPLCRVITWL